MMQCPYCKAWVQENLLTCTYCQEWLPEGDIFRPPKPGFRELLRKYYPFLVLVLSATICLYILVKPTLDRIFANPNGPFVFLVTVAWAVLYVIYRLIVM